MAVMNTLDLTGVSAEGWSEAVLDALAEASRTIRGINRIEVRATSAVVEDGAITEYHTEVRIFFEIESR